MPFNLCGAVHASLFEYDLAVESYAQAIKIDPTSADFYSNMASAQVDRGEIDGAIKSLDFPAFTRHFLAWKSSLLQK